MVTPLGSGIPGIKTRSRIDTLRGHSSVGSVRIRLRMAKLHVGLRHLPSQGRSASIDAAWSVSCRLHALFKSSPSGFLREPAFP